MKRIWWFYILLFTVINENINGYFDTGLDETRCRPQCTCKSRKNSSQVTVVNCVIDDINEPLECNVEWPVLFLTIPQSHFNSILLAKCQNLKKLMITSSSLVTVLKADMFKFNSRLETLVVKSSKLKLMDNSFLKNIPSLSYLDISETEISEIGRAMFEECPIKERLRLSLNVIQFIDNSAFVNCISLKKIDLSNNKLTSINQNIFSGLLNLEILDLSNNKINHIAYMSFQSLTKIKEINLSGNELKTLDRTVFGDLKTLTHLKLNKNKINYISVSAFQQLEALNYLDLSENPINQLDLVLFKGLQSIQNLDLPKLECVVEREADYEFVSLTVRKEFGKFRLCSGKRISNKPKTVTEKALPSNEVVKQKQIQSLSKKPSTNKPLKNEKDNNFSLLQFINDQPYVLPMVLGGLLMMVISVIVVAVVCHFKNKQINELRIQELQQMPMLQSTL